MINLNELEALNLYFFLSSIEKLNPVLENLLGKLEDNLFMNLSVKDIEQYRIEFVKKGKI